jgi:hypothetical protein
VNLEDVKLKLTATVPIVASRLEKELRSEVGTKKDTRGWSPNDQASIHGIHHEYFDEGISPGN